MVVALRLPPQSVGQCYTSPPTSGGRGWFPVAQPTCRDQRFSNTGIPQMGSGCWNLAKLLGRLGHKMSRDLPQYLGYCVQTS